MKNTEFDTFESSANPFNTVKNSGENFFVENPFSSANLPAAEVQRRLNDYDSKLLEEDAYKELKDDLFKLEYKISKNEELIKDLEAKILTAEGVQDSLLAENLTVRLMNLKEENKNLVNQYNEKSLASKISGGISGLFEKKISPEAFHTGKISAIIEKLAQKLPKKLISAFEIRKSLSMLENINKSVDELVSLNIPYGESLSKYEQLSKYIIKANSIQAQISNHLKK